MKSLKQCHLLLEHFITLVPDPDGWIEMLNNFQNVIDTGEKLSLHQPAVTLTISLMELSSNIESSD